MTIARKFYRPGGRYMLKEVSGVPWLTDETTVLKLLEEHHELGFEVYGLAPAGPAIWIYYRKVETMGRK